MTNKKEAGPKPNSVLVIISLAGTVAGPVVAILPEGLPFRFGKEWDGPPPSLPI